MKMKTDARAAPALAAHEPVVAYTAKGSSRAAASEPIDTRRNRNPEITNAAPAAMTATGAISANPPTAVATPFPPPRKPV